MEKSSRPLKLGVFFFKLFRVLLVLIIAAGLAKLLISLKKEPEKIEVTQTPPSVRVILAAPVSKIMTVEAFGTVKPRYRVKVAVEVPGRIDYLHPSFIEGGFIQKGELLLRIDQESYTLDVKAGKVRIKQAETEIKRLAQDIANLKKDIELSRANLALAEKEVNRVKALSQNQFASKNTLDKVEQQFLQAKIQLQNINNRLALTIPMMEQKHAALAMARVDFHKAELAYKKTTLMSPFDGFVLEKFAETGEYMTPGQVIGALYQKDCLDVDVRIPLEKMRWIRSFFENGKTPRATLQVAGLSRDNTHIWEAHVARIKSKIDEKTRTLPMTLEVIKPDKPAHRLFDLKPGIFVKCSIFGETVKNVFVLPRHLLKNDNTLYIVNDGHLKFRKVGLLRKFEDEVYISSGLNPGDKIVSSPLPGAIENMALTIKENGN